MRLKNNQRKALKESMGAALGQLRRARYIPFDTGRLDRFTQVDDSDIRKNEVRIVCDVPYAVFVYHRPNVVFTRRVNWNARAFWFEPFLTGHFKGFVFREFAERLRELNEGIK